MINKKYLLIGSAAIIGLLGFRYLRNRSSTAQTGDAVSYDPSVMAMGGGSGGTVSMFDPSAYAYSPTVPSMAANGTPLAANSDSIPTSIPQYKSTVSSNFLPPAPTPAPSPSPAPSQLTGIAATVNGIYQNLFGRNAESAGLAYWTNNATSGAISSNPAALTETIAHAAQSTDVDALHALHGTTYDIHPATATAIAAAVTTPAVSIAPSPIPAPTTGYAAQIAPNALFPNLATSIAR